MHKYILIIIVLGIGMIFNTVNFAAEKKKLPALPTRKKKIQPSFAVYAIKTGDKDLNKAKLLEPP